MRDGRRRRFAECATGFPPVDSYQVRLELPHGAGQGEVVGQGLLDLATGVQDGAVVAAAEVGADLVPATGPSSRRARYMPTCRGNRAWRERSRPCSRRGSTRKYRPTPWAMRSTVSRRASASGRKDSVTSSTSGRPAEQPRQRLQTGDGAGEFAAAAADGAASQSRTAGSARKPLRATRSLRKSNRLAGPSVSRPTISPPAKRLVRRAGNRSSRAGPTAAVKTS